jgi:ribonuclease HI
MDLTLQVIIRNYKGEAIAGSSSLMQNLGDATSAEAAARLHGLQLVERIGCSPVTIESDSMELVQAFNGEVQIWSPYTATLADCFITASRIGHITMKHCFREANSVAHELARVCFDTKISTFWDCDPLSFILSFVMNDVTLFITM